MELQHIVKAIKKLHPEAEFVIHEDDLESIEWHVIDGDAPTKAAILAAVATVEEDQANAIAQSVADKASAIAKLSSLGLTEDEAKAIIG